MALTDNCHILARFHESAFNNLIQVFMQQRPATFNYATQSIIDSNQYCTQIAIHPDLVGEPLLQKWTILDPISLPLTNESVNYLMQLSEVKFDFAPSNVISLPDELGNVLDAQEIGFTAKVCGGVACGRVFSHRDIEDLEIDIKNRKNKSFRGLKKVSLLQTSNLHCFCLRLFATAVVKRDSKYLSFDITGVEIKDIRPVGLENAIECFILKILDHTVLPQLKIELEKLAFGFEDYFNLGLTPISASVPFNPSIDNNNLNIFLNIN